MSLADEVALLGEALLADWLTEKLTVLTNPHIVDKQTVYDESSEVVCLRQAEDRVAPPLNRDGENTSPQTWLFFVPAGTPIATNNRIRHYGRIYDVLAVLAQETNEPIRSVRAKLYDT